MFHFISLFHIKLIKFDTFILIWHFFQFSHQIWTFSANLLVFDMASSINTPRNFNRKVSRIFGLISDSLRPFTTWMNKKNCSLYYWFSSIFCQNTAASCRKNRVWNLTKWAKWISSNCYINSFYCISAIPFSSSWIRYVWSIVSESS